MKNKVILILALGLGLTGCLGKKENKEEVTNPPPPKIEESVESVESPSNEDVEEAKEEVKESNSPYQDIYDEIEGKEFFMGAAGSYGEYIFFYRDGYFDGMAFTGNGGYENDSLFNGKFDIVEKIDDLTYKIKLSRLDYEKIDKKEEIVSIDGHKIKKTYENMSVLDSENDYMPIEKVDYYILYLPYTKRESLSESILNSFDMGVKDSKKNPDILARFAITDGDYMTFVETIEE